MQCSKPGQARPAPFELFHFSTAPENSRTLQTMKKVTVYISHDDYQWDTEQQCQQWETLLQLLKDLKASKNSYLRARILHAFKEVA